jgi:hypothetical protein
MSLSGVPLSLRNNYRLSELNEYGSGRPLYPIYFSGVYGFCQLPDQGNPDSWQTLKILGLPGVGIALIRELIGDLKCWSLIGSNFFNLAVYISE